MANGVLTSSKEIITECMTRNDTALLRHKIIKVSQIDQLRDFSCQRREMRFLFTKMLRVGIRL